MMDYLSSGVARVAKVANATPILACEKYLVGNMNAHIISTFIMNHYEKIFLGAPWLPPILDRPLYVTDIHFP